MSITPAPIPSLIPHYGDLAPWAQATFYAVGQRITNNGNVYQCTVQGTSSPSGTGPAGGGGAIVDGGATWAFVVAISTAWVALTNYTAGDVVTNDGGKLYQAQNTGTSGNAGGPTGTGGAIVDGGVTWSYLGSVNAQITQPTSRRGDAGLIPGAPLSSGYQNWFTSTVIGWLYYLRDLLVTIATAAWVWTNTHFFELESRVPAEAGGAGTLTGFTGVVHSGTGTGVIALVDPAGGATQPVVGSDKRYVFKITLAGGAGVGKFQWSDDGGATFTGDIVIASPYTAGLIVVTFSGSFDLGDRYAFLPAFTPVVRYGDFGKKTRSFVDHNGIAGLDQVSHWSEEWWVDDTSAIGNLGGGSPVLLPGNRWQFKGDVSASNHWAIAVDGVDIPGREVVLTARTNNGNKFYLLTACALADILPSSVLVARWAAKMNSVSQDCKILMGWFNDTATPSASANALAAAYYENASSSFWQITSNPGGGLSTSGTAPAANVFQRFKLEVHGATSPLGVALGIPGGSCIVLLFVDEKLVTYATPSVWTGPAYFGFGVENTGALGVAEVLTIAPWAAAANCWDPTYPS